MTRYDQELDLMKYFDFSKAYLATKNDKDINTMYEVVESYKRLNETSSNVIKDGVERLKVAYQDYNQRVENAWRVTDSLDAPDDTQYYPRVVVAPDCHY